MKRWLWSLLAVFACNAFGQAYPTKPIRIVIPFPPGNTTNIMTRLIAPKMADEAEERGHIRAELWLAADDPRRMPTFEKCEGASHKWLRYLPGEVVQIPYENVAMPAYFIKPEGDGAWPLLISFGGPGLVQG